MSWEQLLSIMAEQAEDARQAVEERRNPQACPNDGEPMKTGPDGRLFCPFDGYRPA